MFTYQIIPQGQRVSIWDRDGKRTIVEGPKRIATWRKRVEFMEAFVAGPTQYLVIQYRDGRIEHRRGPAVFWFDRVEHLKLSVADAIPLDANEAVVVYRQQIEKVDRRVVRGPELFVPQAQEWLHEFHWHGADKRDERRKVPNALVFNKLRVIPDQLYFDVQSVRTADDALVIVKLMIFFELMEIEVMLDQTHDVVGDFINAVTADVIDFAGKVTFDQFKEKTHQLNVRESYPQLASRLGRIGYRLNKVVYRGYQATEKLQAMHDNAIEARTRLKLDAETEVQAQELADLKQQREQNRAVQRQQMQQAEVIHEQQLKQIAHTNVLRQKQAEEVHEQEMKQVAHTNALRQRQADEEQALEAGRKTGELKLGQRLAAHQQRVTFLQGVRELQVDMTRYLVARNERPDRRIRLEGDRRTQLHLHESD